MTHSISHSSVIVNCALLVWLLSLSWSLLRSVSEIVKLKMSFTFLDRFKDGQSRVKDIDKGCKAKFSFQWMDDPIAYEDEFGVHKSVLISLILRKPEVYGKCFCVSCNTLVYYAKCGKIAWIYHWKTVKHMDSFRTMINNNKLHSNFFLDNHDTIDQPQSQSTMPLLCTTTHTVSEFEQQTVEQI